MATSPCAEEVMAVVRMFRKGIRGDEGPYLPALDDLQAGVPGVRFILVSEGEISAPMALQDRLRDGCILHGWFQKDQLYIGEARQLPKKYRQMFRLRVLERARRYHENRRALRLPLHDAEHVVGGRGL